MTIEERFEILENKLRRQKRCNRWLLGAVLLVAGSLLIPSIFETTAPRVRAQGVGATKVIRANKFVVEDLNGKDRAVLTVSEDGSSLVLYDDGGKGRIVLAATKLGPSLSLYTINGNYPSASLNIFHNSPDLMLLDEEGKPRAQLDFSAGVPNLCMWDINGKPRVMISVLERGPTFGLADEEGIIRFVAGKTVITNPAGTSTSYPESSLILLGPDGKVIWSAIK